MIGAPIDPFALACELDRAYGYILAQETGVDFFRRQDFPWVELDEGGLPYVEMVSLEWHTRKRVSLGLTELQKAATNHPGRIIVDRIEKAVAELREPPPFWLGEGS